MKIAIAGAGIGGLTAALCLLKAGHEVVVFEQSEQLGDVGAGIQCGANALHVLDYLGLLPSLYDRAVRPESAQFRDFKTGKILHSVPFGDDYEQRFGLPYLHLHRADLQGMLLDALHAVAPAALQLNTRVSGFTESADSVTLNLQDARTAEVDLLIGADGIRSTIRQLLGHTSAPQFTGNVAWRIVVPTRRLPANWMDRVVTNFVGPGKHAVLYYIRDQELANLVGVVENSHWTDPSWTAQAAWEELKSDYAGWHPMVQSIIDAADHEACYRWALYQHRPLACWSSNRVTLLGDAAHATLPFMAAGAGLAIEDARILQRALSSEDTVANALQTYQRVRQSRTAKVQNMSAQLGRLYHLRASTVRRMAFGGLRILMADKQDFLPAYNPNTVKLT
jgi:salicylate hydroxylase